MKTFLSDRKRAAAYLMMIVVFIIVGLFAPREKLEYFEYQEVAETIDFDAGETMPAETIVDFGAWTLLVPVVMFVFVLLTKGFLEAFIWASFLTVFMRFRMDTVVAFTEEQISAILNYDNARMLLLYLGIGSVLAAVSKGGGAKAFANWAQKKATNTAASPHRDSFGYYVADGCGAFCG